MIKLSILIRTIPQRAALLQEILAVLEPQLTNEVELLTDPTFPQIMGTKCNNMLRQANGEYVAFVDDDDLVPDYYVAKFLEAIDRHHPDIVSIEGQCYQEEGTYRYIQTLHSPVWAFGKDGMLHQPCTGICAVKRDLAIKAGYEDVMYYEDRGFSERIKQHAKTEHHLPWIMYIHRYTPVKDYQI